MQKVDLLLSLHLSAITTQHSLAQTLCLLPRHTNKYLHLLVTKLKFEEVNHTTTTTISSIKVLNNLYNKKLKDILQVVEETVSFFRRL